MSKMAERAWSEEVEIAAPEPELTSKEIIARAAALKQRVWEEQEESERRGVHSEELHREFLKAGFYRMLQPRRFGGYEFDIPTFWRTMVQIAEGDPGTGWCLTLASHHAWVIGSHWPEQAQREIFGPEGDFRAPHRPPPAGTARRVDGGYVVSGQWDYCSGVPYSTHFMGGAVVPNGDAQAPPEVVQVVVPPGQFTVLDDWGGGQQLGMQSSGSQSVKVEEAFVPEHWVLPRSFRAEVGATAGTRLHGNPMYLGMIAGIYHGGLVLSVVGAAKAALNEFEQSIRTRKTTLAPQVWRYEHPDYQRVFGVARGMTDAAENLLYRAGEVYMEQAERWAETGEVFSRNDDMRIWGILQQSGRMASEAVELLFRSASSSSARRGARMLRYYRDVAMYRGHVAAQWENLGAQFARLHFGLEAQLPG
ncbi:MAG: hydroxylase [Candidatus Dormibacteraeota bacterium]|nr:hydroxylase [Candidatus Dormibacteraeota bacterium]